MSVAESTERTECRPRSKPTELLKKYMDLLAEREFTGRRMLRYLQEREKQEQDEKKEEQEQEQEQEKHTQQQKTVAKGRQRKTTKISFYRVIQRLKRDDLVRANRVPRDPGEYPGTQCIYGLTQKSWEVLSVQFELFPDYAEAGFKQRLSACMEHEACSGRGEGL